MVHYLLFDVLAGVLIWYALLGQIPLILKPFEFPIRAVQLFAAAVLIIYAHKLKTKRKAIKQIEEGK